MIATAMTAAAISLASPTDVPLFANDAPITISIEGPIGRIARGAERSTDPREAILVENGHEHSIQLSARGLSRRSTNLCRFPPLRVTFTSEPGAGSLFEGQRKLKLVTHCQDSDLYERHMLREYAAYRVYNALTPESFQVRLARIRYVEGRNGRTAATRYGFFIEDIDDVAKRLGGREVSVESSLVAAMNPEDAARVGLFQHLISNHDWSIRRGPRGSECCHNMKLIGASEEARSDLTPIPYDFDQSGWVDAPYAVPPAVYKLRSVRQRFYRGFCMHNATVLQLADTFREARPAMERALASIPMLGAGDKGELRNFIASFYSEIADPGSIASNLIKDCR